MSELYLLNEAERRVLAGLIYAVAMADRVFSREEAVSISEAAAMLATSKAKGGEPAAMEPEELFALLEVAADEHEESDWVGIAVEEIAEPSSRAAIFKVLQHVAEAEAISPREQAILDALAEAWALEG